MAQRRMFSLKVIDTDNFMEMPVSARELYFQFGMRADDDGFVGNPKRIMKMIGASDDDLRVLIARRFIIPMSANGICVITHWKVNNFIRPDRYDETQFKDEKAQLSLVDGKYSFEFVNKTIGIDAGIPNDIPMVDPGKDRLGKDSIDYNNTLPVPQQLPKCSGNAPCTVDDVKSYCNEMGYTNTDAEAFIDHYTLTNWMYGKSKTKIKDWKAAVRGWERRQREWNRDKVQVGKPRQKTFRERNPFFESIERLMEEGKATIDDNGNIQYFLDDVDTKELEYNG